MSGILETDRARLDEMLEAAQDACSFVYQRTRADLDADRMLLYALAKAIEYIGESANQLSDDFRSRHQHIAWAQMIGMRNRLVHAFRRRDHNIMWSTVNLKLPPLIAELETILSELDDA